MNYLPFHSYPFPIDENDISRFQWNPYPGGSGQPGFPPTPPPFSPGFPSFPGTQPSFPPSFPPLGPDFPGGGQQFGGDAPTTPPPSFTPQMQQQGVSIFAVDPGSMRRCLRKFTFVWLNNGRSFWFYPTYVGRTSVAGYRWRRYRWVYYGTDADRISSFQCY